MFGLVIGLACAIGSAACSACCAVGAAAAGVFTAMSGGVAGLCSAISAIGAGIASAATTIGTALATAGKAICTAITTFVAQFPKLDLKQIIEIVKTAFEIIQAVAEVLGIGDGEDQEELGERALQHPEIKRENFDSEQAYIEALKQAEFKKGNIQDGMPAEGHRWLCRTIGASIQIRAISEKLRMSTPMDFFLDCAKIGLKAKDVYDGEGNGVLEKLSAAGVKDAGDLSVCLRDGIDPSDADERSTLQQIERALDTGSTGTTNMSMSFGDMKRVYEAGK